MLVAHCGFADHEIMKLSSFNMLRVRDLEALVDDEVQDWVKKNNITLITYKDLDI